MLYAEFEMGDYEALLKDTDRALNYYPNQATVHYLYAEALRGTGKTDQALTSLDQAYAVASDRADIQVAVLSTKALILEEKGQRADVDRLFDRAQEIAPA